MSDPMSEHDKSIVARARELAALSGEEIRGQSGYDEPSMALADFAGRAQHLLFELTAIIDRGDGLEQDAGSTT